MTPQFSFAESFYYVKGKAKYKFCTSSEIICTARIKIFSDKIPEKPHIVK